MNRTGVNKAAMKRMAAEVRSEVGIDDPFDVFDPYGLAGEYGIQVLTLADVAADGGLARALDHFTVVRPEIFSAAVIPMGTGRVIVENHVHEVTRRRSTLAHEMSHVVLEHEFTTLLRTADEKACRQSDKFQEEEAAELSGELLLPSEAALQMAYNGVPDSEVARRFNVSVRFASWRMNSTGARLRAVRRKAKYAQARTR